MNNPLQNDHECGEICTEDFHRNLANCPCAANCPKDCPCPDFDCSKLDEPGIIPNETLLVVYGPSERHRPVMLDIFGNLTEIDFTFGEGTPVGKIYH